jgi:hypothetical protein
MAHTVLNVRGEFDVIQARLNDGGVRFKATEFDGNRIMLCKDPAGNRWELRG